MAAPRDPWADVIDFGAVSEAPPVNPAQQSMGVDSLAEPAPDEFADGVDFTAEPPVEEPAGPPLIDAQLDEKGNVVYSYTGQDRGQGTDTGLIGEDGGFHIEQNPKLAGANASLNEMLKEGARDKDIARYLQGKGASPEHILGLMAKLRDIRTWQKKNPGYTGDYQVDVERVQVPNTVWQNFANSDVGAAGMAAGDAASAFTLDNIAGAAGGDAEQVRQSMDMAAAAHPKSTTAGTVAGGVTGALAAEAALAKTGLTGLGRTVAADTAYGAGAGAGATDKASDGTDATLWDRAKGAGVGAVATAAGGVVGNRVANMALPAPNAEIAAINAARIPTTIGQQYSGSRLGGLLKRSEDAIASVPILGDMINARRAEGIVKFNQRAFDRALEPIGVNVGDRVGEEAVDFAQNEISDAFERALVGKAVVADATFADDLTAAVTKVRELPRVGPEVADNVRAILEPYMKAGDDLAGSITGESMQQMSRELRDLSASYVADPLKNRVRKAVDEVESAIFGPFKRQAPELLPAYNKAKVAQRRLYTLAEAVNKAKNQEGIFMPSQLGFADRAATVRTEGKVNAARGRGQFQDLQRVGQKVLPSKLPDSGTATRLIAPAAVLGVGGGVDYAGADGYGIGLAAILAAAYTKHGQRFLTKPGRGATGRVGRAVASDRGRKVLSTTGAGLGVTASTER